MAGQYSYQAFIKHLRFTKHCFKPESHATVATDHMWLFTVKSIYEIINSLPWPKEATFQGLESFTSITARSSCGQHGAEHFLRLNSRDRPPPCEGCPDECPVLGVTTKPRTGESQRLPEAAQQEGNPGPSGWLSPAVLSHFPVLSTG